MTAARLGGASKVFLGGQAISLLGNSLAMLAIPLLVLEFSRDPVISGLSAASVTIGYVFVGLPAGVLVDRFDPWRVLMLMDASRTVLFFTLFGLGVVGELSVSAILAIAFLAGICHVFFETALVVVVKDLFQGLLLIRANAGIELAAQLSLVLGPAITVALAAAGSLDLALLINALTFLVSLVSLIAVWRRRPRTSRPRGALNLRNILPEFRVGLRYLLSVRILLIMTAIQIVVNLGLGVERLLFYYARDTLDLTPELVSAVIAAGGVGGILGALSAGWFATRLGEIRLVAIAIVCAGAAVAAMSLTESFATLALTNLAYAWAVIVGSLVNRTFRQRLIPRELLGRVTSTARMLFLTAHPIGVLLAGAATSRLSGNPRPVFLAAGLIAITAAITGWLNGLATYHRTSPPTDQAR